jgi:hypothetical protein
MIQTIHEMTAALKTHPDVIGLIEYGSQHQIDAYATGDIRSRLKYFLSTRSPPPGTGIGMFLIWSEGGRAPCLSSVDSC